MTTPANMLKLGPFIGGMNTYSDPAAILDNEMVDCVNMEVGFDRTLRVRPPIVELRNSFWEGSNQRTRKIIGTAIFDVAGAAEAYLFGATQFIEPSTILNLGFFYITTDGAGHTWSSLTSSNMYSRIALQYADELWIIPSTINIDAGITSAYRTWRPDVGLTTQTVGPKADTAVIYRERFFVARGSTVPGIAGGATLFWSEPGDPDNFPGINFVEVGAGDGQNIIALIVYNDTLIIFKQNSTWQFTFDIDPGEGTLRQVNATIGTDNRLCVVQHENSVFVYQGSDIYEMVNLQFVKVNPRTPFTNLQPLSSEFTYLDPVDERHLSVIGDRLICRYFGSTYVYNLRTRTWSRWRFGPADGNASGTDFERDISRRNWFAEWHKSPFRDDNGLSIYFATLGAGGLRTGVDSQDDFLSTMLRFKDGYDEIEKEQFQETVSTSNTLVDIECNLITKRYNMDDPFQNKRLQWWGIQVITNRDILSRIIYSAVGDPLTWNQWEAKYPTFQAWEGIPYWKLEQQAQLQDEETVEIFLDGLMSFIRFKQSVFTSNFTQFELDFLSDGSSNQLVQLIDVILSMTTSTTAPERTT